MTNKQVISLEDMGLRDRIYSDALKIQNDNQNELLKEYGTRKKEELRTGVVDSECAHVKKYYDYILTTKQAQIEAFMLILSHIDKVQKTTAHTTDALEYLKKEIDEINGKIAVLEDESDSIIKAENGDYEEIPTTHKHNIEHYHDTSDNETSEADTSNDDTSDVQDDTSDNDTSDNDTSDDDTSDDNTSDDDTSDDDDYITFHSP